MQLLDCSRMIEIKLILLLKRIRIGRTDTNGYCLCKSKTGNIRSYNIRRISYRQSGFSMAFKKNKESSYASQFNPYLINPIDQGGRALISKLMPHVGKKYFVLVTAIQCRENIFLHYWK